MWANGRTRTIRIMAAWSVGAIEPSRMLWFNAIYCRRTVLVTMGLKNGIVLFIDSIGRRAIPFARVTFLVYQIIFIRIIHKLLYHAMRMSVCVRSRSCV